METAAQHRRSTPVLDRQDFRMNPEMIEAAIRDWYARSAMQRPWMELMDLVPWKKLPQDDFEVIKQKLTKDGDMIETSPGYFLIVRGPRPGPP